MAGKDISMGGILGTVLMLVEASGVGAQIEMDGIPRPLDIPLGEWVQCFPSFGFLLSVKPQTARWCRSCFGGRG